MSDIVKPTSTWHLFFIAIAMSIGAYFLLMQKGNISAISFFTKKTDSVTAQRVKQHLQDMSESLVTAEKTGDRDAALEVMGAVTKVINEFNNLPEDSKNRVLTTELRYCHLASLNLSEGAQLIYQGSYWLTRDRFNNAINMCH